MAQSRKVAGTQRMIVHDAVYRVIVLRNTEPAHEHDSYHAFCVERNLGGRGDDVASAIHDLALNLAELIGDEYAESLPDLRPALDPELVNAYDRRSDEVDGWPVIRRGTLRIRLAHSSENKLAEKRSRIEAEELTFSPDDVELATA